MFDVLIREAGARFGLGDKALPLVQMLLAYMTAKESGGLAGFLEKFKAAGVGPVIQSWLGGGPSAQPIGNSQIETVLGASGGLLSLITGKLGLGRDNVASALGYLLPAIVGKLTPGGSIPSSLPAEVTTLAAAGQSLLAAPPPSCAVAPAAGGGLMKWLPWAIVALAALFGVSYCGKNRTGDAPAPVEAPAPAASAAPQTPEALPAPAATGSEAGAAASGDEPSGAAVVGLQAGDMPALKVYFDSGQTDVHGDFAARSKELVDYMAAHADAKAVISGFNDPTGNAAANEELSKNRAKAVQAALVGAGVAEDRTVLEKPADATGSAASNAASRRVEVVLRK